MNTNNLNRLMKEMCEVNTCKSFCICAGIIPSLKSDPIKLYLLLWKTLRLSNLLSGFRY